MISVKTKPVAPIDHVRELLNEGRPEDALKFIEHLDQKTPEMENARAVCLLRLGHIEQAVNVLRKIVFHGDICMPSDTPVLYQLNFATAMLMSNYKSAARSVLDTLDTREHPEAGPVKDAVNRWVKTRGPLGRLRWRLGWYPPEPVKIDFLPGQV
jgi:hypothetical protein